MSEQITPEQAHGFLMQNVYVPVFLEKLANDFGIVPQNEGEVAELLKIASHLEAAKEQEQIKQAQARGSLIGAASSSLENAMGSMGFGNPQVVQEEALVKAASENLAANPSVQAALAVYHNALAQHVAN
jgi:hypothetical protein